MSPETQPKPLASTILLGKVSPEIMLAAKIIAATRGQSLGAYALHGFEEMVRTDAQELVDEGIENLFKNIIES